jgi:hypothetical protein
LSHSPLAALPMGIEVPDPLALTVTASDPHPIPNTLQPSPTSRQAASTACSAVSTSSISFGPVRRLYRANHIEAEATERFPGVRFSDAEDTPARSSLARASVHRKALRDRYEAKRILSRHSRGSLPPPRSDFHMIGPILCKVGIVTGWYSRGVGDEKPFRFY